MSAPWALQMDLTMARPRPAPPCSREREPSTRKKRLKTCGNASSWNADAVIGHFEQRGSPARASTDMWRTRPPPGVYLMALSSRLTTTCFLSRARITLHHDAGGGIAGDPLTFLSVASRLICSAVVDASSARSKRRHSTLASPASSRDSANRLSTISASRSTSSSTQPSASRVSRPSRGSWARLSSSPRITVSGVRSTWLASATNQASEPPIASCRRLIM